jgi:hypothetical protein
VVEAGLIEVRGGDLNVNKVPLPRLFARPVCVSISELVRPGRCRSDIVRRQVVCVGCKQRVHTFPNIGLKERLRDKRNNLVAFITPSERFVSSSNIEGRNAKWDGQRKPDHPALH